MIRIRRVDNEALPANRSAVGRVKEILRLHFPSFPEPEIERLGEKLRSPFRQRFRSILFVAEMGRGGFRGFALLYHDPVVAFCFLDYLSSEKGFVAGEGERALYTRVRQEALALKARGLFLESPPDDPALCPDRKAFRRNRAALRFLESFGARPIVNARYQVPPQPGPARGELPYLVVDDLGGRDALNREFVHRVVRAVLKRKFGHRLSTERLSAAAESFVDDPVRLRPFRYGRRARAPRRVEPPAPEPTALVVNDRLSPAGILAGIGRSRLFRRRPARPFPEKHIGAVHAPELIAYLRQAGREVPRGKSLFPYVFPVRNRDRFPRDYLARAGYYCLDTATPLHRAVYRAARGAVDAALTAARCLVEGDKFAYALVRPPGHHAERGLFGGACYFNNAGVAAHYLSAFGKVAVLDLDYHHGNGLQDIFYRRSDVLTVSIHAHPRFAYPHFSGFEDERGEGSGEGFNLNLPLGKKVDGRAYRRALERALRAILEFKPSFVIVALGFDTAQRDSAGTWSLLPHDFFENGARISELGVPILVVQEGGFRARDLRTNARRFFAGLLARPDSSLLSRRFERRGDASLSFRYEVRAEDRLKIREIVEATGVFSAPEIDLAVELADERLAKGPASGYHFVFADYQEQTVGYSCYGPIAATGSSFDLYWIAVHPDAQGKGWGRILIKETERRIRALGGTRVYIDTSNRPHYAETRAFYESCGYRLAALLDDFYARGDAKTIYCKIL